MNQKPTIKAVIFDLGGVILRTLDAGPREGLARRYGLSYAALDQIVFHNPMAQAAERGQASHAQVWQAAGELLHAPASFAGAASEAGAGSTAIDLDDFARQFFAGDAIDWELARFIRGLRRPGRVTALLSNAWYPDLAPWLEQRYRVPADTFDVVISSAQCGLVKPDPRIYALALAQVGAQPAEAIFVDDSIKNVEAARALGIHAIHYRRTPEVIAEIQELVGKS